MSLWDLKQIYDALKCKVNIKENIKFNNVIIDSRDNLKGSLFIPIKGQSFDGHDFIKQALEKGANASLVNRDKIKLFKNREKLIPVKDTLQSLEMLAIYARKRAKNCTMICITGSSGKTTLKEWLKHSLDKEFKTYANFGNFNNQIGMPLSLARMPENTELSILEIGMNQKDEIKKLSEMASPNIAIITNIGEAHIGNFKSKNEIANEKSKILIPLEKNGIAIIPRDDSYFDYLKKKASKHTKNIYSFGMTAKSSFQILKNKKDGCNFIILDKKIYLDKIDYSLKWKNNISIILGVSSILKLQIRRIKKQINLLKPLRGRGEIHNLFVGEKKIFLIDESYNSNPDSLILSIKNIKEGMFKSKRKICIIGDMLELGKFSKILHENIVNELDDPKISVVITVGKYSKIISQKLSKKILTRHFNNHENVYNEILKLIKNNDVLMIKGSNSVKLNKICEKFISLK